ncbi:MAG: hypothetical protein AABW68_04320 [archaeon]
MSGRKRRGPQRTRKEYEIRRRKKRIAVQLETNRKKAKQIIQGLEQREKELIDLIQNYTRLEREGQPIRKSSLKSMNNALTGVKRKLAVWRAFLAENEPKD